jgi:hypothetical protein
LSTALAQKKKEEKFIPQNFTDSVSVLLKTYRSEEATSIAETFANAYQGLPIDQQQLVKEQYQRIRTKKLSRISVLGYLGSVAHAKTVEQVDDQTFRSFLTVASKVIEKETPQHADNFFSISNTFFKNHALHVEKAFKLYASHDQYTFEYIEPVETFSMDEPLEEVTDENQHDQYDYNDSYDDNANDSWDESQETQSFLTSTPLWMDPPPQPVVEGPALTFSTVTLNFTTRYDSVFLKNTKGSLSFRTKVFVGEGGTFDWTPAGLHPDSVFCAMTVYNFPITRAALTAVVVKLTYIGKTTEPIPGTFEFKSETRKDSVASSYPRFKSYETNINIQGLGDENMKIRGGFSLTGKKISSASVNGNPSTIEVYQGGVPKFVTRSSEFVFTDSTVIAQKASIKIFQKQDSLSHPSVRLKYTFGKDSLQKLHIIKDKGLMKHTPYSSTYFNVDFSADIIKWDLFADSLDISISGGNNVVPMVIESIDYYDLDDYTLLKGQGFSFHPLALVGSYCVKNNVREFYTGDLADFSKKEPRDVKAAIEFLSTKGLLEYDVKNDLVRVKEKAIVIYKSNKGESDYDNMKILSIIDSAANATLNFKEGYLLVRGVDEFKVSDSLNVRIQPDSSIITIYQNRDIKFDGTINAGNFEISGKGFMLKYDSFFIDLKQIDSINFFVTEKNSKGQNIRRKLNNNMVGADSLSTELGNGLQQKGGTLFISRANNKSGIKKVPNYPRLDASSGGLIYFDRPEVLGGVYDRSMFFVVPPFKLDSLNDADPASINFEGTFASSGMFPSFKEKLRSQPDKSLGFEHRIPKGGYKMYNGEAVMNGDLTMNNRGLRGIGTIDYLAAKIQSHDFIFYPDSVIGGGQRAIIRKELHGDVLFPQASLPNFDLKWYPKEDNMRLRNKAEPFNFYDSTAQMRGTLTVSKQGVSGAGKFETRGSELVSREMQFLGESFSARHARFKVNTEDPEKPLLNGVDVRLRFDLNENYADISPEVEGVAAISFPYAQFKTSIPRMRWNLDEKKITMSKDKNTQIENSYFYTTRKELDSLYFNAESAVYDLVKQELKVSGIPYIKVADAKITPENNEVLILENAKIGTLKNTTIILDTLNGYHLLKDGVVDIISRKEFTGYATYQYINLLKDTFSIKMTDFHLEDIVSAESSKKSSRKKSIASQQTVATGAVSEDAKMVLGAGMFYKGDMVMYATKPALQLKGFVKLDIKKIKNYNTWIQYDQSGDETDVFIDFTNPISEQGNVVNAGLHFDQNNELYITFISDKRQEDDEDFYTPMGKLHYDTTSREFKIEHLEKANGTSLSGKVFAYNDDNMQVRFEGPIQLFNGGKDFKITATALGNGNLETNEIRMNTFLMMETNVPDQAFTLMAKQLQDVIKNEGADEGLGDQTELLYKIADIVGERVVKDYEQKSLQGYVPLTSMNALVKPLVLSNVNLKWSQKNKGFYSEGTIGVSNISRNDINGAFEGFLEVKKTEEGNIFHLFFKASPEAWYYFGFEDNRLMVHSSNGDFNSIIAKRSNVGKVKIGEVAFIPGSDEETLAFINRFRRQYYGIDIPYSLNEGGSYRKKEATEEVITPQKNDDDGF